MTLQDLFEANRPLFYSLFGQVFFLLGIAIALIARRDSAIPLARPLWLLAAFGMLHGFYDWSYVALPIQKGYLAPETYRFWEVFQRPLEALSFFFLFQFGAATVCLSRSASWLLYLPGAVFLIWTAGYLAWLPEAGVDFKNFSNLADLWARYLLCFPGALLAALGLWLEKKQTERQGLAPIQPHLAGAAAGFLLFAVVAGLLVPPAEFFPASWVNRRILSAGLGIPSPIVRALAGALIVYFILRSLKMFEIEIGRRLEENRRLLAIVRERERIGRELHDGILQNIYGAGLQLENLSATLPPDLLTLRSTLRRVIQELNWGIREIREAIFDLSWDAKTDYRNKIQELAENLAEASLKVRCELEGAKPEALAPGTAQHLYHFVREALSNVAKHSRASEVSIVLRCHDGHMNVSVADNGIGFEVDGRERCEASWQHGLKTMRARAEELGAELMIDSARGKGTRVALVLPVQGTEHKDEFEKKNFGKNIVDG